MYKRVLVALDGSEQSRKALDHAAAIAEKFGSELTLLAVVPRVTIPGLFNGGSGAITPVSAKTIIQEQEKMEDVYRVVLADAEARVRSGHPDLSVSTMLREGHPSSAIVDVAESEGCELIVMGSRGIRGITALILGSTNPSSSSLARRGGTTSR